MNGRVILAGFAALGAAAAVVGSASGRAAIGWAIGSWLRPADAESSWEQDTGARPVAPTRAGDPDNDRAGRGVAR